LKADRDWPHATAHQRQHTVLDQTEYQRQYDEYAARFEATRIRKNEIRERREALIASAARYRVIWIY
jgi:hypothetical protein